LIPSLEETENHLLLYLLHSMSPHPFIINFTYNPFLYRLMSFLSSISGVGSITLKPTKTRVTDALGRTSVELRSESGAFQTVKQKPSKSSSSSRLFMVIDNSPDDLLHEPFPGLFISSQDGAANLNQLVHHQIHFILNVATGVRCFYRDSHPLIYMKLKVLDVPEENLQALWLSALPVIHEHLNKGKRVLIHCNAGISRSSAFLLAYLIVYQQFTFSSGLEALRKVRPSAKPNDGFCQQLRKLESLVKQGEWNKQEMMEEEQKKTITIEENK
jgi:protein-tyrosine phosphatase